MKEYCLKRDQRSSNNLDHYQDALGPKKNNVQSRMAPATAMLETSGGAIKQLHLNARRMLNLTQDEEALNSGSKRQFKGTIIKERATSLQNPVP